MSVEDALPAGWSRTTLGILDWGSGGTPLRSTPGFYGGDIPWIVIGDLRDGPVTSGENWITEPGLAHSSARWVAEGSVLLAMYGSIGKLGIAGRKLTTNQAIAFTDPRPISNRYLFWYLFANRAELSRLGKGDTQRNISQTVIKGFPLTVAPLPEQHRIVAEIEKHLTRLGAAVASLGRVKANLKRYRASVLKAACEGRLVPTEAELARAAGRDYEPADQLLARILAERRARWEADQLAKMQAAGKPPNDDAWKARYVEPKAAAGEPADLPEGWCWATVDEVGSSADQVVLTGPFGTSLGTGDFRESGVPVLTIGCLTQSHIDSSKAVHVSPAKAADLSRYRLAEGDLLFSRMATVGRAGLVPNSLAGALVNYHIMRLRLSAQAVNPRYFLAYVRGSQTVGNYTRGINHGATRDGINTEQLLEMPVALAPLTEQQRIVAEVERRLSFVDELEATVATNLKRAERLRQSILKLAFEGKLVPQDPDDEPASVLLARINAERAQAIHPEGPLTIRNRRQSAKPASASDTSLIHARHQPDSAGRRAGHSLPHFHAQYGEYEIIVDIRDGAVTGRFPRRALQ